MKAPVSTERQVQRAILRMAGLCFPEVLIAHIPNGAFLGDDEQTRKRTMGMLLGDGLKKGFPDLLCVWNHGIALIEVKRPGGRLSPEQKQIHETLSEMGFQPVVVTTPEEAFLYLKARGAPCRVRDWRVAA